MTIRDSRALDQTAVDALVVAAHTEPELAGQMLSRNRALSKCRSAWGETGIEAASHVGHKDLVWRFVEAGAAFDLFAACALGDARAAISQYDPKRPDICGVHGLPLLHFAVMSQAVAMLETLLSAGVEVNPKRAALSPLHSAVAGGSRDLVCLLLHAGADPDARDAFGATPLDWALELDGEGAYAVRRLLRHGHT